MLLNSHVPTWSCFGWGLPCQLCHQNCGALLPQPFHPYLLKRTGGLFSVALSLRSPSLDVIQHPDPVKPGLSSTGIPAAAIQPSALARICAKIRPASQMRLTQQIIVVHHVRGSRKHIAQNRKSLGSVIFNSLTQNFQLKPHFLCFRKCCVISIHLGR